MFDPVLLTGERWLAEPRTSLAQRLQKLWQEGSIGRVKFRERTTPIDDVQVYGPFGDRCRVVMGRGGRTDVADWDSDTLLKLEFYA